MLKMGEANIGWGPGRRPCVAQNLVLTGLFYGSINRCCSRGWLTGKLSRTALGQTGSGAEPSPAYCCCKTELSSSRWECSSSRRFLLTVPSCQIEVWPSDALLRAPGTWTCLDARSVNHILLCAQQDTDPISFCRGSLPHRNNPE